MKKMILKYYPFLPLLLLSVFYVYKAVGFPIHDFANYYFGGKFLAEGHFNSNIYFPYHFNKAISDLGNPNIFASYAPNTPFLAFFFLPFSWVSVATAKLLFNGIAIVLFVLSIYRLFAFYTINPKWALLIPILFLIPIKNNLLFGQVYFLLFFLLAEGWLAYEKKQLKWMALFWSVAVLLKVFPAVFIALLLFKKQWKALAYLTLSGLLLFVISLLFTGFDIWIFYMKEVLPKAANGEIASAFVPNYQSVFMFLKELLVFDVTDKPQAAFHNSVFFSALMPAFKIGILAVGYFISRRISNALLVLSYWILAMILLSPYGSTYTFILLLFPFLALVKSNISNVKKGLFCLILFLICNLPLSVFINNIFPFSYLRLFLLLLFFGLFVIQFRQKTHWKSISVLALIPMILVLIFQKQKMIKSTILMKGGPILIYDYKIETSPEDNHKYLTANFWDGKDKVLFWKQSIQTAVPLDLKNNQVFYNNQQLSFDLSNKLKPILIDNKTILYLSDCDRGIGFYTLRIIKVK